MLYEGLLGGGVYVNAFYTITKKVKRFSLFNQSSMAAGFASDEITPIIGFEPLVYACMYVCAGAQDSS